MLNVVYRMDDCRWKTVDCLGLWGSRERQAWVMVREREREREKEKEKEKRDPRKYNANVDLLNTD